MQEMEETLQCLINKMSDRQMVREYLRKEIGRLLDTVDGDINKFAALKRHEQDLLLEGLIESYASSKADLEAGVFNGGPMTDEVREGATEDMDTAAAAISTIKRAAGIA
ncbi:MAG: hypothetical protein K9L88_10640 [Chromatiaceae bacterium]|nr:hypothetical protein [Chromatiaceae bacterium]